MAEARAGIEDDIQYALDWLARSSRDSKNFWDRLTAAQISYQAATSASEGLGQDPNLSSLGPDVVATFLAQSKSLLDDRRSYDPALSSLTVPWIKQIGRNIAVLDNIPGAQERTERMLRTHIVRPDSAVFELVMASNYAADGFEVSFVEEAKGKARMPDLQLLIPGLRRHISVECKRLDRGQFEREEQSRHKLLFQHAADQIDQRELSLHIDVIYTSELKDVPETYLADHLSRALSSPIISRGSYPWRDSHGFGEVRPANLNDVKRDIRDKGSLYFGTKLARLLAGRIVRESGYHLVAGADPDDRDPRFIEAIYYGSVVTWQCVSPTAIEKKGRYVRSKLAEADRQLAGQGPGIVHIALDAELQSQSSDLRRQRNIKAITSFRPASDLRAIYIHYLVPRISEAHSWLVDETVDRFGPGSEPVPTTMIFSSSKLMENDLPAWKQDVPVPNQ